MPCDSKATPAQWPESTRGSAGYPYWGSTVAPRFTGAGRYFHRRETAAHEPYGPRSGQA